MSYDENTGKEPSCPICGLPEEEWQECKHLVAVIDLTFGDCYGGELFDRDGEFRQTIENSLLAHLGKGSIPGIRHRYLEAAWKWVQENCDPTENHDPDGEYFNFNEYGFWSFLVEVLEEAGAESLPGSWTDGIPLATSIYAMLFAEAPAKVIEAALRRLRENLR